MRLSHTLTHTRRQKDFKSCPLTGQAVGRDGTMVLFGYLFAQGQAETGACIFAFIIEAFEKLKYLACIFLVKTDAIILHCDPDIGELSG